MSAMSPLNFGICGLGFMGRTHLAHLADHPRARAVAVCAKSEQNRRGEAPSAQGNLASAAGHASLEGVRAYEQIGDLIADPVVHAVIVALPTPLHAPVTIAALAAGKHVLCEKPMALRLRDCDRMIEAAEAAGRTLMVGQCIRFWPAYERIKQMVDAGEIGAVRFASLRRLAAPPAWAADNWLMDARQSGGALFDLHVHDVDYARHLLGLPETIQARGGSGPSGGVDHVASSWGYADGRYALLEGGFVFHPPWPFEMAATVHGTRGTLDWSMRRGPRLQHYAGDAGPREIDLDPADGWRRELDYFVDCVLDNRPVERCSPDESRAAIGLTLLERRAAQTGRTIRIPPCVVRRGCGQP
jgi:predicted dehydrogenase